MKEKNHRVMLKTMLGDQKRGDHWRVQTGGVVRFDLHFRLTLATQWRIDCRGQESVRESSQEARAISR